MPAAPAIKLHLPRTLGATALLLALMAPPLWAHPGAGAGVFHGLAHPLAGTDHLLAMLAVGLWAAQGDRQRVWLLPLAFVLGMIGGGVLGMSGVGLPAVEAGILMSVVLLGALIALALRPPLVAGVLLVALFGLFHGHAHGTEMPLGISGLTYAAGFTAATAMLHAAGAAAVIFVKRSAGSAPALTWARLTGSAIAAAGLLLAAVG
jgi:urease accessory protein